MEDYTRLERIEKTISDTNSIVKELQDQLRPETSCTISGKASKALNKTLLISARNAVKKMLKLFNDRSEPIILTYESYEDVKSVRDEVTQEILINKTNQLWATNEILNEAFYQVWENLRDDNNRQLSGKKTNHRASNRRNKRRHRKLNKRLGAIEKSRRSSEWKAWAKTVMTRECTSPDMTDTEEGSDQRFVLPLIWESQQLRDVKEHLDQLGNVKEQEDHPGRYSNAEPSQLVPSWAVRTKYRKTGSPFGFESAALQPSDSLPLQSSSSSSQHPSASASSSLTSSSTSSSSPPSSPSINLPPSPDLFCDFSFSTSSLTQSTPKSRPSKRRSF